MADFLGYLVQGEDGFASNWSIMHFLSGLVPHALYAWLLGGDAWISLYVLAFVACVFELVENTPGAGKIMWTCIGYTTENYRIDSLQNSQCDVLFLLLGWLVAQVVHLLSPGMTAFWVVMGVAAVLFVAFLWLFSRERARWHAAKQLQLDAAAAGATIGMAGGHSTPSWSSVPRAGVPARSAPAAPRLSFRL